MIDIEDGLQAFLLADPAVAALIGERILPLQVPPATARPAIAYQRISTPEREQAHDGPLKVATARIQLTLEGRSYAEAKALARAVRERLDGYRGLMTSAAGSVMVFSTRVANDQDGYSDAAQAPVVRVDVFLQHQE